MFRLDEKTVLITGASSGIGAHLAQVAAGAGGRVIAAARRKDRLGAVMDQIAEAGGKAQALELDVTDADAVSRALAQIGPVDVLVNNAGIAGAGPSLGASDEDWQSVIDTNLTAPFRLARDVIASNIAQGRPGNVINIASILAERGARSAAAYSASKAGVANLTRALAVEWARKSIRVNAIAPGYFITEINKDHLAGDAGDKLRQLIPMARFGEFADLSGPFLLLASDASSFMTGSIVTVDGGQLAGL